MNRDINVLKVLPCKTLINYEVKRAHYREKPSRSSLQWSTLTSPLLGTPETDIMLYATGHLNNF